MFVLEPALVGGLDDSLILGSGGRVGTGAFPLVVPEMVFARCDIVTGLLGLLLVVPSIVLDFTTHSVGSKPEFGDTGVVPLY